MADIPIRSKARKTPISPERANFLGAHAAEAENQIRSILMALERGDHLNVTERLKEAEERCQLIRQECYWE